MIFSLLSWASAVVVGPIAAKPAAASIAAHSIRDGFMEILLVAVAAVATATEKRGKLTAKLLRLFSNPGAGELRSTPSLRVPLLLRLDARCLDDLRRIRDLALDELLELGGRHRHRLGAERRETFLDLRRLRDCAHVAGDFVDGLRGRSCRGEQPDPEHVIEPRQAGFGDGRHV